MEIGDRVAPSKEFLSAYPDMTARSGVIKKALKDGRLHVKWDGWRKSVPYETRYLCLPPNPLERE